MIPADTDSDTVYFSTITSHQGKKEAGSVVVYSVIPSLQMHAFNKIFYYSNP